MIFKTRPNQLRDRERLTRTFDEHIKNTVLVCGTPSASVNHKSGHLLDARCVRSRARQSRDTTGVITGRALTNRADGKVFTPAGPVHYLSPRRGLAVDGRDGHRVDQAGNEAIGARGLPHPQW
jgi:hypothetical protein